MKISELKIGDKVKFTIPKECQNIHRVKNIGIIKNISNVNGFCIKIDVILGGIDIWINEEKIISKIETITNEKEIFIDPELLSEPKNSQFISYCNGCQRTFVINKEIKINDAFICDNCWELMERVIKRLKNYEKK